MRQPIILTSVKVRADEAVERVAVVVEAPSTVGLGTFHHHLALDPFLSRLERIARIEDDEIGAWTVVPCAACRPVGTPARSARRCKPGDR